MLTLKTGTFYQYPSSDPNASKTTLYRARMDEYTADGLPATLLYGLDQHAFLKHKFDNHGPINVNIDLNEGYNKHCKKPDGISFDELLQYIIGQKHKHPEYSLKDAVCYGDFVIRRGLLARIMMLPYEANGNEITVSIKRYQSIFFIKEVMSVEQVKAANSKCNVSEYWPIKFKHAITTVNGNKRSKFVNTFTQFQGAFMLKLADASNHGPIVFYGSKLDAFDENGNHVLVKNQADHRRFDPQMLPRYRRWYLSCLLTGATDVVIGFRNKSDIVTQIEKLKITDLRKKVIRKFDASVCYNRFRLFLTQVRNFYASNVGEDEHLDLILKPTKVMFDYSIAPDSQHQVLTEAFLKMFPIKVLNNNVDTN